ncbi:MAG: NUDIX domain-containing protein, partial [Proteobacteria bacterium]|nr:NUDIX domain-containing protein [Pseudomonadota bacterium]
MTQPSSIVRTSSARLVATREPWEFAQANREAIAAYWRQRTAANPSFYDGEVFVLRRFEERGGRIEATFSLERFSAFLYARDAGAQGAEGILDGFASAVVRSADGAIILGRTAPDTLNAGRLYLPGGFLDARDEQPDGSIDLAASTARELAEETGIDPSRLVRMPGTLVVSHGRARCFAIEYRSPLASRELLASMRASLESSGDRELTGLIAV